MQGTTDITRTIGIGTLSEEQKKHYTAVLRGNLNLAAAYFKYGCTGVNLVRFAREAILPELMSEKELELLNAYHARVFEKISPHLSEEERHWLAEETEELKK